MVSAGMNKRRYGYAKDKKEYQCPGIHLKGLVLK